MSLVIKNLDGDDEVVEKKLSPALSLTHIDQGGAANKRNVSLLMKAEDVELTPEIIKSLQQVTVTMSMEEFLRKWFNLYWDDATLLAKLMGYETDGDDYSDWYEDKMSQVTLLKASTSPESLTLEEQLSVLKVQQLFEQVLPDAVKELSISDDVKVSPEKVDNIVEKTTLQSETKININKGDTNVSDKQEQVVEQTEDVIKAGQLEAIIKAAVEKATSEQTEKLNTLTKALEETKAEKEAITKAAQEAKDAADKADIQEFVKGVSFIGDEAAKEQFAEVLFKAKSVEGFEQVVEVLKKGQAAIEAAGAQGSVEVENEDIAKAADTQEAEQDLVMKAIKAKFNK